MGLLSGLVSITTKDIGKKVGLSMIGSLLSSPVSFLAVRGLEELFGTQQGAKLDKIIDQLKDLDNDIAEGFNNTILTEEHIKLNDSTTRLNTFMGHILQAVKDTDGDIRKAANIFYSSWVSQRPAELIDNIYNDAQNIHYILCGEQKDGMKPLLSVHIDESYRNNSSVEAFSADIENLVQKAATAFLQAIYIEATIMSCDNTLEHRKGAVNHMHKISNLYNNFLANVNCYLRDIPDFIENSTESAFMLHNKSTGEILGRYAELTGQNRKDHHTLFELIDHGDGYFYLKIAYKNQNGTNGYVGIDHYYGEDIRPVKQSDSGNQNHIWKFEEREGWFNIVNRATGQCLDHYYGNSIKANESTDHPNRLWQILPDKSGRYCYIVNKATGALLGYNSRHGSNKIDAFDAKYTVDVGAYNGGLTLPSRWNSAKWKLNTQEDTYHNLVNIMSNETIDHYDGKSFRFVDSPSAHPNHCWRFDATALDTEEVVDIKQEEINYHFEEEKHDQMDSTWKLVLDDSSEQKEAETVNNTKAYMYIRNKATNQVLDHYYGKNLAGANNTNAHAPNHYHIWCVEFV